MWAIIVSIGTSPIGPIWVSPAGALMIIAQVFIVVSVLLVRYIDLKRNNVILWKRSYPDWSDLQKFVTLPENGLPSFGKKRLIFDILVSIFGILSITSVTFFSNYPFFTLFIGIPSIVLLASRILVSVKKLNDERDPYERSRVEFGINLALLTILDGSVFWLFSYPYHYRNMYTSFAIFPVVIFVLLGGVVLLFEVLVEAQNLWWKTEKKVSEEQQSKIVTIRKDILRKGGTLLVKIIGWLLIVDSIIIYLSLVFAPEYISMLYFSRFVGLIGAIALSISLVIVYCLTRYLRIKHYNSSTFVGRRTRLEALVDSIISIFLIVLISGFAFGTLSDENSYRIIHFFPNLFDISINLGEIVIGMDFLLLLLVIIALILRIHGNILEFKPELKIDAAKRMQKSGKLMLIVLPLIAGGELIHYTSIYSSYASITVASFYFFFMITIFFVAFQVIASELKVKELTKIQKAVIVEKIKQVTGNNDHSSSIAN